MNHLWCSAQSSLVLFLTILLSQSGIAKAPLPSPFLETLFDEARQSQSVEGFLRKFRSIVLSRNMEIDYVPILMSVSEQYASPGEPRVLATIPSYPHVTLGFSTAVDKTKKGTQVIEVIGENASGDTLYFAEIDFAESPPEVHRNPDKCRRCHANNSQYRVQPYPVWQGWLLSKTFDKGSFRALEDLWLQKYFTQKRLTRLETLIPYAEDPRALRLQENDLQNFMLTFPLNASKLSQLLHDHTLLLLKRRLKSRAIDPHKIFYTSVTAQSLNYYRELFQESLKKYQNYSARASTAYYSLLKDFLSTIMPKGWEVEIEKSMGFPLPNLQTNPDLMRSQYSHELSDNSKVPEFLSRLCHYLTDLEIRQLGTGFYNRQPIPSPDTPSHLVPAVKSGFGLLYAGEETSDPAFPKYFFTESPLERRSQ